MKYHLECTECGSVFGSSYNSQICRKCGGILEVFYEGKFPRTNKIQNFWDMEAIMPNSNYRHYYLGNTPVIKSKEYKDLCLKLEFMNPTHSFKDRGSAIEVAKAKEYGFKEVVCASTGNMAYSTTYYAKLYGMRARVFISDNANADKIKDIKSVGDATITKVDGDFTKAQGLAIKYAYKEGAFLCGDYCYRKEGQKSIAYEIMDSNPKVKNIIVPVGNATLLSATYKALAEMESSGKITKMPRIIAVQSEKCQPLVRAFKNSSRIKYEKPDTMADAIAVGYPTFGEQGIEGLKRAAGVAVSVSEQSMASEQKRFMRDYGLAAELASVSTIAAYRKLLPRGESVAVITGANV
ncbi:MAG: pyridoxal-phosphate dependent enzyme [Candidatus Marsarchaeota archaeon]|nr:pyridoxal-phosphate dependent enzyme [Candidatus Marsarchaeota archaeon]